MNWSGPGVRARAARTLRDDRPAAVRRLAAATVLMLVLGVLQLTVTSRSSSRHERTDVATAASSGGTSPSSPAPAGPSGGAPASAVPPKSSAPRSKGSASTPSTGAGAPEGSAPPAAATPPKSATTLPVKPPTTTPHASEAGVVAGPRVPAVTAGAAFRGLATWIDVYDWSDTYTNGKPTVGPDDVDAMVAAGVQTLYVQTARQDTPDEVLEPDKLQAIIARARARGLTVVTWVLPGLEDLDLDMRHLHAAAALGDALGVDIESTKVDDVAERNRRVVQLSSDLRASLPKTPIAAIVLPPVVLEVVNPAYWPDFPWRDIAPFYDVWMPMSYWTNRSVSSGYRDAYKYTTENIVRLRNNLGQQDALVHAAGGIGDQTTAADIDGFVQACAEQKCIGGGIYDWHTTAAALWPSLDRLRAP